MTAFIGWLSSAILLLTVSTQVVRQWRAPSGVSIWLFIGQFTASLGFTVYSALQHDTVFIATNAMTALAAATGIAIALVHRRRATRPQGGALPRAFRPVETS